MEFYLNISPDVRQSVSEFLQKDSAAKKIAEIEYIIAEKRKALRDLEIELETLKMRRPDVILEYRKSISWCLEIDAGNPEYFLKSKEGLVKCVEYKHKIKLTSKQNNSFGGVLSGMFKEGLIGRTEKDGMFFYGLRKFFDRDSYDRLTKLKKEFVKDLKQLKRVS